MNGGTISGNTASAALDPFLPPGYSSSSFSYGAYGGGVYVGDGGRFTKQSGGTIYGSDAGDTLKNAVTSTSTYGGGHAVYVESGRKRNTTAGVGVTLNSAKSGSEGGWE
jgi:hypothetical protein